MSKGLMWLGITIGGIVGSLVPLLWHAGSFSFTSIIFGGIGSLLGIWAVYKLNDYIGL
jgi:hypothetical protein